MGSVTDCSPAGCTQSYRECVAAPGSNGLINMQCFAPGGLDGGSPRLECSSQLTSRAL
jgi:hypothetical protein